MIFCLAIVPWARLHSHPLQWFLLPSQRADCSNSKLRITVPQWVIGSLEWWRLPAMERDCLFREPPCLVLTTDASLFSWAAHLQSQVTQGRWTSADLLHDINWLELRARSPAFSTTAVRSPCIADDGQCHDQGAREPPGMHTIQGPDARSGGAELMSRETSVIPAGRTHLWNFQHPSGLAKQDHHRSSRMATTSRPIPPAVSQVRPTICRPHSTAEREQQ